MAQDSSRFAGAARFILGALRCMTRRVVPYESRSVVLAQELEQFRGSIQYYLLHCDIRRGGRRSRDQALTVQNLVVGKEFYACRG